MKTKIKPAAETQLSTSNITDNESAKMKTSKGVIQGDNGVTMVDAKKQIIVAAEAYGHSREQTKKTFQMLTKPA